jgi:hypothetical protein
MSLPRQRKLEFVGRIMDIFSARFDVLTLAQHAQKCLSEIRLPVIEPQFRLPEMALSANDN